MAPRFHTLTVTDLHRTTKDALAVTLCPDAPEAFIFAPGQYLTFRQEIDGVELRRSYSICAGPDDGALRVGIKHVPGGAFSGWATSALQVGDRMEAMPPMGQFTLPEEVPDHVLFVAGGSGITPILSLLKTLLSRHPNTRATLLYANRDLGAIMFRDEIEDLKDSFLDRLVVVHMLESGQEIPLFSGRLDAAHCDDLFACWIRPADFDLVYICGPGPMREAVEKALQRAGITTDRIRTELFASAQPGRLPQRFTSTEETAGMTARITVGGVTTELLLGPGQSVLEAARAAEIDAPYACTAGVCSTCRAKLRSGAVEMRANHALEYDQVRDGYILTCQSYGTKGPLEIDYDA